jgi:eukaryotic-like serine/threonine-protein kinase
VNASARQGASAGLPKRVGRYVALHPIGVGGMARVYLGARHTPQGLLEQIAIKELKADAAEDHRVLAAFLGEARIATRLDHPNVVRCHEVVAEPPNYYLAMEFIAGQSLLQIVRRLGWHGIPRDVHIWLLTRLLAGLEHAHELADARGQPFGIVHRDVSPSNLMVGYDGQVKLLDFGIAKASGAVATTHERPVRGKLGYIAPEQCLGEPANARSDLYAVGVMLWEAVARRRRLSGETPSAILRARLEDSEQPLDVTCPDAPPALLAIARRALARLPAARYSSAREMRRDLEQYLAAQPDEVGQPLVAALMQRHFAPDRAKLQEVIEAHGLTAPSRSVAPPSENPAAGDAVPARALLPDGLADEPEEITSPIPVDNALLIMSKVESSKPIAPSVPPVAQKRLRLARWLLPAGLAAAALGGLLLIKAEPKLRPVAHTETTNTARPNLALAARAAVGQAPANAASQGKVALRIEVKPSHTRIRLDGRLLKGNPYLTTVERDSLEHELSMTAEGHKPATRTLRFDDDVDMEINLVPEDDSPRPSSNVRAERAHAAEPSVVEKDHGAGESIEPGMDLAPRTDRRSRRKIDERDPYER